MQGFFDDIVSREPPTTTAYCGGCGMKRACKSPNMPPTGEGRCGVLVVAEAPGEQEDAQGTQLIGQAGQLLREHLDTLDIDLDRDCWKTNALTCRPPKNRKPTDKEIEACRPHLLKTIRRLKPRVLILLGQSAVQSFIGKDWHDIGTMGRWAGWRIPWHEPNMWVCPTYHPSYLLRNNSPALAIHFKRHLRAAFAARRRPWTSPPDYGGLVAREQDPARAAKLVRQITAYGGGSLTAFDYETNMLKPDSPQAQIVTCSIAWGKNQASRCVAYPWHGEAITATKEYLLSPIPKVASNLKFEERWTRAEFGHGVRGWSHDTMLAAHTLDNRPGITGLKFQAFVRLGMLPYDEHIKPYLRGGTNTPNKIHKIGLRELLLYNGLDSVLELELAFKQMEELEPCV